MSGKSDTYDSVQRNVQLERLAKSLPGFDVAEALVRLDGNIACYKELLNDLCNSLVAALSALRSSIQDGGIEDALILLHGLKGMSGNLGATSLTQVFQQMEQALATSQERQYDMLINHMEHTIQQNIATISAFLQSEASPPSDPPPLDAESEDLLIETLKHLAYLLDQGQLDAVDTFKRLKSLLHRRNPHPEFNHLAAAMGRLDYTNARTALTALAASMHIVI